MVSGRICVGLLLVVFPAFGQESQKNHDVIDRAVPESAAVRYWSATLDPAHTAGGKCNNCHEAQSLQAFAPSQIWDRLVIVDDEGKDDVIHATIGWDPRPATIDLAAGLLLAQPDKATRSMLMLPGKAGVIVKGVCGQFKNRLAGLREHDIVLKLNDKPAVDPAVVDAMLASDGAVRLLVRRDGTDRTLTREASTDSRQARYLIGVTMGEVEPVVRAQLKLDSAVRVYVRGVASDGAAAKAGFKPYDIIVKVDGKSVANTEAVQGAIQRSKGKPMTFALLRAGKPQKVKLKARLTPSVVDLTVPATDVFEFTTREAVVDRPANTESRLAEIERKLGELTRLIKSLKE